MEIEKNVFTVGAIDPERKFFDELIPLPNGTSYNSYLVKGREKIALIDTVDPTKTEILLKNLKRLKIKHIDFIVANHAEQDHTGSLTEVIEKFPEAKVICSEKCRQMLIDLLNISADKIQTVKDRENIILGGKTLQFFYTPWVHWPETISTYLLEDRILFSCDFFGSHLAVHPYEENKKKLHDAAKLYYAEIMMPFPVFIKKNLKSLPEGIEIIAPSHGPIYKEPLFIINLYNQWASDKTDNLAMVLYVSMHGSTKIIAEYMAKKLNERKIHVKLCNLALADIGEIASALLDTTTLIIATPTYLTGMHPKAFNICYFINTLKPKTKAVSIVTSYGWASNVINEAKNHLKNLNSEFINPVIIKGIPKKDDFESLDALVKKIADVHRKIKFE